MKNTLFLLCTGLLTLFSLPSLADNWNNSSRNGYGDGHVSQYNNRRSDRATGYYNRNRHSSGLTISLNLNNDSNRNWERQNRRNRNNNYDRYDNRNYNRYSRNSRINYTSGFSRGLYTTGMFGNYSVIPFTPSAAISNRRYSTSYNYSDGYYYNNNRSSNSSRIIYSSEPVRSSTSSNEHNRRSGTGLIRDIHGNCFEFSHDRYGNESRVQVDPQRCDF